MDLGLVLCYIFQKVLIPFILGITVIARQNIISSIYLILLLIGPILPSPTADNFLRGSNGIYLKINILISAIANLAHLISQIIFVTLFNYPEAIDYCSFNGQLLNFIGIHRYDGTSVFNIIRLGCLDFIVLAINCLTFFFCKKTYILKQANSTKDTVNMTLDLRLNDDAALEVPNNRVLAERQWQARKRKLKKDKAQRLSYYLREIVFWTTLCAAAILEPSITSSIYFFYFLFLGTWFSLNHKFTMGYQYFRIFIAMFVAGHFLMLFLYQFLLIRPILPPDNINARLFGVIEYTSLNCTDAREFVLNDYHFVRFFHPITLILLYFISVNLIRTVLTNRESIQNFSLEDEGLKYLDEAERKPLLSKNVIQLDNFNSVKITDDAPLLQSGRIFRRYDSMIERTSSLCENNHHQTIDSLNASKNASISSRGALETNIHSSLPPTTPISIRMTPFFKTVRKDNRFSLFCFQLITMVKQASYVITLIVMMTWSITYHSWLSFILLLASCIIWMTPNSRQTCLRSSPLLVIYAMFLVLGQYIYSFNLSDKELPVFVHSISINEIGFKKYGEFSYQPLAVKIFYTIFFWITLSQYNESLKTPTTLEASSTGFLPLFNMRQRSRSQTIQDPNIEQSFSSQSRMFDAMIKCLKGILIKYWIWIVAIMLMVMSLSESKVVIYRIVYMFLFMIFTCLFLISLKWWRKLIYPFWLVVIFYSMIILIAIYTYQFNHFPEYWKKYFKIDLELQEDLGLVVYDNDAFVLFKELFTPTFFIIITIIQVHFVHKDFLEFSNIDAILIRLRRNSPEDHFSADINQEKSNLEQIPKSPSNEDDISRDIDTRSQPTQSEISLQTVISRKVFNERKNSGQANYGQKIVIDSPKISLKKDIQQILSKFYDYSSCFYQKFIEVLWCASEVHINKLVYICIMIVVIRDISVMNVLFVFLAIFAMIFIRFEKILCFIFALWAAILVLLKMSFQLKISQRISWETDCTDNHYNQTLIDNRAYIGFIQTDNIFNYIWEYLLLIIVLVLRKVLQLSQNLRNHLEYDKEISFAGVIFPEIDRKQADKSFINLVKYFCNYGFYKFGVEICLVLMTITIGNHSDIFSVIYCIWLIAFILLNRQECQKYWKYLISFIAISIPYQYLMCLGIPPGLCLQYPWSDIQYSDLEWYYLPTFNHPLPKNKLYLDFILFYFLCRQNFYFRSEKKLRELGGSNLEAFKETTSHEVFDFFSFGTTAFDTFKSYFLVCFFWITLAVLFLAGTTRINLFGLGYVLGSFIFLWNGNEFFLKPVRSIFKSWTLIILYTCIVMFLKSLIQVFVVTLLRNHLCWLVQLLGITYHQNESIDSRTKELLDVCPTTEAGLLWDGICLTFLLIQKRIFCSHYFKYLIREIKAQQFLASRGAELIHEIQAQEVSEQEIAEREVMEKIKQKMDRIKEAQQKMFANQARSIKYHKQAVKSGGYYMFDDKETDVCDLSYNTRESLIPDPEGREIKNIAKSKGFTAFCSKLMKGESSNYQEPILVSAEQTDIGESSKDSPIISVEREKIRADSSLPTSSTFLSASASQTLDKSLKDFEYQYDDTLTSGYMRKPPTEHRDSPAFQDEKTIKPVKSIHVKRIENWCDFIRKFTESIVISLTSTLNAVSRDYRFVAKRLTAEKKCLKKVIEVKESEGINYDFVADPVWKKSTLAKLSNLTEDKLEKVTKSDSNNVMSIWGADETTCISKSNRHIYMVSLDSKYIDTSIYIHFFRSIFYAILSRSEIICYITIVINQITSASILSLPLPLMAFLWGSLSVPRPSKSFWVTCITYIEIVVVVKYVFQFNFWRWIDEAKLSAVWWPRLLGIEKKENYANYDLILLLVLFFHRFMLKSLGLWDLSETEIKAYMTNAELLQSHKDEESASSIKIIKKKSVAKKLKSSKPEHASCRNEIPKNSEPNEQNENLETIPSSSKMIVQSINDNEPTPVLDLDELTSEIDLDDCNCMDTLAVISKKIKSQIILMCRPLYKFLHNVLHPPYRITYDVYALMFLCDFINFFILVFGFYAFGSGYSSSEDVARFLEENKIPIGFLITLLVQFSQIIIDRAIYLRKYIEGKLIFQIIIVIFTHIWLFFALPAMTDKAFTDKTNLPPKLWYIFKCIYFLLSAFQIRSGYPTRILGNTFCKKYNFINLCLFKTYMLIPFVYDLRMYMDWIWTDTSLVLDEWSLMEDIFVNLYQRKCELKLDEEFPEPRGRAKKRFFKYLLGGFWVIIIIALIWGPLVLFAFGRAVGEINPPIGATFELEIAGYQPLFKMSVTDSGLMQINDRKWSKLHSTFRKDSVAQTFINGYDQKDVFIVNLNGNSTAVWGISPPSQKILESELLSNQTLLNMKLTYYLTRKKTKTQDMETTIYDEYFMELHPTKDVQLRRKLAEMIASNYEQKPVVIPHIFPNYLRAPEKGKPIVVKELQKIKNTGNTSNKTMNFRNLSILLKKGNYENDNSTTTSWWEIHDDCQNSLDYLDEFFQDLIQTERCQFIPVIVFNDKVFIGLLAFLSGYGIIGIYTTFVFLVSRWVRGLNSESSFKVIYTRMPNVDRVLQLCLDIYLVRESREFELEEDLYAKLIFLYRSPETLIKWTKINEEINNSNPIQSANR
ncbi:hypothetical protein NH340_JMT05437 [Sarcoptes scabiei]|nr:hypothetical protein NH340_JMT05437 [Sarcoptes scabiei]